MAKKKKSKTNPIIKVTRSFQDNAKLEDKFYTIILNALPEKAV